MITCMFIKWRLYYPPPSSVCSYCFKYLNKQKIAKRLKDNAQNQLTYDTWFTIRLITEFHKLNFSDRSLLTRRMSNYERIRNVTCHTMLTTTHNRQKGNCPIMSNILREKSRRYEPPLSTVKAETQT